MKPYWVEWHTRPSPGATYYEGVRRVFADSEEEAAERAQVEVHRSFKEYSLAHIVIVKVHTKKPSAEE